MKLVITRWKAEPLKPKPFSPRIEKKDENLREAKLSRMAGVPGSARVSKLSPGCSMRGAQIKGAGMTSPVQRARKFSAVFGTTSSRICDSER